MIFGVNFPDYSNADEYRLLKKPYNSLLENKGSFKYYVIKDGGGVFENAAENNFKRI